MTNKLQKLYDNEINFVLFSFYDEGISWKLGDDINGFEVESEFIHEDVEEAINALYEAAENRYYKLLED